MTHHTIRPEQAYNALVGRGRPTATPSIDEVRRDTRRRIQADLSVHGV